MAAAYREAAFDMTTEKKRRLIWVPIIHTQADLGSLSGPVRDVYVQQIGRGKWAQHIETVAEMWKTIRREVLSLHLPCEKVRLYQDGLPRCGHEEKIVRDLAKAGSDNHQILLELMERGAQLTGTESPELLMREYELARRVLLSSTSGEQGQAAEEYNECSGVLLDQRDRYIAERIGETLGSDETGLIFLGLLHSLEGRLPPSIEITVLSHCLPGSAAKSEPDPAT